MNCNSSRPKLELPKWQWKPGLLVDVVSFLLGFLLFFFPSLPGQQIRYVIGFLMMSVPITVPGAMWLGKAGRVACLRMCHYPRLYEDARQCADELVQAESRIFTLVQEDVISRAFELEGARYDQGRLYIELKKKRGRALTQGDVLLVVHTDDEKPMA